MYQRGVGDESLRKQLRETDQQIETARSEKQSVRSLNRSRKTLLLQLAGSLSDSDSKDVQSAAQGVQVLTREVEDLDGKLQAESNRPSPTPAEWGRIGTGYAAIVVIAVVAVAFQAGLTSKANAPGNTGTYATAEDSRAEYASEDDNSSSAAGTLPPLPDVAESARMGDEEIVALVLRTTSSKYREAGFKGLRFGDTEARAQTVAADWNIAPMDVQNLFIEEDRLVGYERIYHADNDGHIASFRDLFGKAPKDDITQAVATQQGMTMGLNSSDVAVVDREETMMVRYCFPRSLAYLIACWRIQARSDFGSPSHREFLTLNIFDRTWVESLLVDHVAETRRGLQYVKSITTAVDAGNFRMAELPTLRGTEVDHSPPAQGIEASNLLADGKIAVAVELAREDLFDRPKGSVAIGLHPGALLGSSSPLRRYRCLAVEVDKCNSLVAQTVLPPRGETIQVKKDPDSLQKSYSWRTSDGWKVRVEAGCHIYVSNIPGRDL